MFCFERHGRRNYVGMTCCKLCKSTANAGFLFYSFNCTWTHSPRWFNRQRCFVNTLACLLAAYILPVGTVEMHLHKSRDVTKNTIYMCSYWRHEPLNTYFFLQAVSVTGQRQEIKTVYLGRSWTVLSVFLEERCLGLFRFFKLCDRAAAY